MASLPTLLQIARQGCGSHPICAAAGVQFTLGVFRLIMSIMHENALPFGRRKILTITGSIENESIFPKSRHFAPYDKQIQFSDLIYH